MAGQKVLGDATEVIEHFAADIIVPSVDTVIIELLKLYPNINNMSFVKISIQNSDFDAQKQSLNLPDPRS